MSVRSTIIVNLFLNILSFSELGGRVASVRKVGGMQQGGYVSMAVGGEAMQVSSRRAAVLSNAVTGRRAYYNRQNETVQGKKIRPFF